jgi:hypothetical protein
VLSTSTRGQQSSESPCAPPNPAPVYLGQGSAWSTSNGCDDQHKTPVGRSQNALERPLRGKGETTETAAVCAKGPDACVHIRLQPTGPQIDFEQSAIRGFEKPCSKSITPLGLFIHGWTSCEPNGPLRGYVFSGNR